MALLSPRCVMVCRQGPALLNYLSTTPQHNPMVSLVSVGLGEDSNLVTAAEPPRPKPKEVKLPTSRGRLTS